MTWLHLFDGIFRSYFGVDGRKILSANFFFSTGENFPWNSRIYVDILPCYDILSVRFYISLDTEKLYAQMIIVLYFSGFFCKILKREEDTYFIFKYDMQFIFPLEIDYIFYRDIWPGFREEINSFFNYLCFRFRNKFAIVEEDIIIEACIYIVKFIFWYFFEVILWYEDTIFSHSPFFITDSWYIHIKYYRIAREEYFYIVGIETIYTYKRDIFLVFFE